MTTNYYEHTGIQTLARRLIERAVAEIWQPEDMSNEQ
jgi:hypothetical protein